MASREADTHVDDLGEYRHLIKSMERSENPGGVMWSGCLVVGRALFTPGVKRRDEVLQILENLGYRVEMSDGTYLRNVANGRPGYVCSLSVSMGCRCGECGILLEDVSGAGGCENCVKDYTVGETIELEVDLRGRSSPIFTRKGAGRWEEIRPDRVNGTELNVVFFDPKEGYIYAKDKDGLTYRLRTEHVLSERQNVVWEHYVGNSVMGWEMADALPKELLVFDPWQEGVGGFSRKKMAARMAWLAELGNPGIRYFEMGVDGVGAALNDIYRYCEMFEVKKFDVLWLKTMVGMFRPQNGGELIDVLNWWGGNDVELLVSESVFKTIMFGLSLLEQGVRKITRNEV